MRICIITTGFPTPYDPGKYAFVDQLACTWADLGNEVTVIYPIPAFAELFDKRRFYKSEWTRETASGNRITVECPRFFSASDKTILGIDTRTLAYRSFQKALCSVITRMNEAPDVLYGHFLPSGCQAGDVGSKMSIPSYCAFGESSLWSIEGWDKNRVKNSLAELCGMISVSTENKRVLTEHHLYRESDIEVFPNGVDHKVFCPGDKAKVRKKLGLPDKAFIGAFTGAFNDDKGVLRAQEAATRAGHVEMIYVGGGALKPEGENILFSGRLSHEDIPEYLSAADFFILPTKAEGCCNAIIEAMACGLPIISANGAYNDDILTEEYAIRTDPADIDAMANAIREMRDDPAKRQGMSQAALKASLKFDITKRAAGILEFMQQKMQKG